MTRALVVQLARLGDLVQSLPAVAAIRKQRGERYLDVLCAAPLVPVMQACAMVDAVIPWDGERWREWARRDVASPGNCAEIVRYLDVTAGRRYVRAYNLNQHDRAILAAHLFASDVRGPGEAGPLTTALSPWAEYLRAVARERGPNRVHLADAFCGLCGVRPTGEPPRLSPQSAPLPPFLSAMGEQSSRWIGVIVGAGARERWIPPSVWSEWIMTYLRADPETCVVLLGSQREQEAARVMEETLPPLLLGRVWNATGRIDLTQLMTVLGRCEAVVGSDTGPLHLAAALGTRVMGFYFAKARIHETGPYGRGHWVWQSDCEVPQRWPIRESVALLQHGTSESGRVDGWQCWQSRVDRWGAYYTEPDDERPERTREEIWQRLTTAARSRVENHELV